MQRAESNNFTVRAMKEKYHGQAKRITEYLRCSKRNGKMVQQLKFLEVCEIENVLPKHLRQRPPCVGEEAKKMAEGNGWRFLKLEQKNLRRKMKAAMEKQKDMEHELALNMMDDDFCWLENKAGEWSDFELASCRHKLHAKLWRILEEEYQGQDYLNFLEDQVLNLSNMDLEQEEFHLLAKGHKHRKVDGRVNGVNLFMDLLKVGRVDVNREAKTGVVRKIVSGLGEEKEGFCGFGILRRLREKMEKERVVILKGDKNNSVVLMNQEEYEAKVGGYLEEKGYRTTNRGYLGAQTRKVKEVVQEMVRAGVVERDEGRSLIIGDPVIPQLVARAKTHKEGCPIRPIVNGEGCPTEKLERWLWRRMKEWGREDNRAVKSGEDFCEKVKEKVVPEGYVLVGVDVKDMFNDVDLNRVIEIAKQRNDTDGIGIDSRLLEKAIKACVENKQFKFEGKRYLMGNGVAMGSVLSGTLADLIMREVERRVFESFGDNMAFWYRYVDDVICCVKGDKEEELMEVLNGELGQGFRFVKAQREGEWTGFLDVLVKVERGALKRKLWIKKHNTFNYVKYYSDLDEGVKKGVVRNLLKRVVRLTDEEYREGIMRTFVDKLRLCGYPMKVIAKIRGDVTGNEERTRGDEMTSWIKLPMVREGCRKWIRRELKSKKVGVVFATGRTMGTGYRSLYEKKKDLEQKGVVYKVDCEVGCQRNYIGSTGRRLSRRLAEHKSDVRTASVNRSALAEHCLDRMHWARFDSARVIGRGKSAYRRKMQEAYHCMWEPNVINKNVPVELDAWGKSMSPVAYYNSM